MTGDTGVSRRGFLRGAGVVGVAVVAGVPAVTGGAAAADPSDYTVPDHVTIDTTTSVVEAYQPRLTWAAQYPSEGDEPRACYGVKAESADRDTDAYVFWHLYDQQHGIGSADSHAGDHEPVYVFVNSDGSIEEVVFSALHWRAGRVPGSDVKTVSTANGEEPVMTVVGKWHHHLPTPPESESTGRAFALKDLDAVLDDWLTNGMSGTLRVDQPYDPWVMKRATDWWQDDALPPWERWFVELKVSMAWAFDAPSEEYTGWSE